MLVDLVVVDPDQRQTYLTDYNPAYAGELRVPLSEIAPLPLDPRKVIARRAAMELAPARSATSARASRPASPPSPPRRGSSSGSCSPTSRA